MTIFNHYTKSIKVKHNNNVCVNSHVVIKLNIQHRRICVVSFDSHHIIISYDNLTYLLYKYGINKQNLYIK